MTRARGCLAFIAAVLILAVVLLVGVGIGATANDSAVPSEPTKQVGSSTRTPSPVATAPTAALAQARVPTPALDRTVVAEDTPTPRPTRTARATPTPTPQITYAACDDVPTYLLRLDTKGRVAVERSLVPSQPDGDNDGYACGDQLEHKRQWARITVTPTLTAARAVTPVRGLTARPCLNSVEVGYLLRYGEQLENIAKAADELSGVFGSPGLVFTTDGHNQFVIYGGLLLYAAEEILNLQVPDSQRIRAIDRVATRMAESFILGIELTEQGVNTNDAEVLDRGVTYFEAANRDMTTINQTLPGILRLRRC